MRLCTRAAPAGNREGQPELLARHFTEAGLAARAVAYLAGGRPAGNAGGGQSSEQRARSIKAASRPTCTLPHDHRQMRKLDNQVLVYQLA
jgi:hypothetical protein